MVFAFPSASSLEFSANEQSGLDADNVNDGTEYIPQYKNTQTFTNTLTSYIRFALASAFRRLVASWTHIQYGESISAKELAREIGMVRHGIGLRPGARVLGVVL